LKEKVAKSTLNFWAFSEIKSQEKAQEEFTMANNLIIDYSRKGRTM
jgi:hypothetical protein